MGSLTLDTDKKPESLLIMIMQPLLGINWQAEYSRFCSLFDFFIRSQSLFETPIKHFEWYFRTIFTIISQTIFATPSASIIYRKWPFQPKNAQFNYFVKIFQNFNKNFPK